MDKIVIIGAGIGGLTTAAILSRAGLDVTVLEAHVYAGGCAGTFFHKGYQFDAGATLAGGFYPGGPMDIVAKATGIKDWSARNGNPAMISHLSNGQQITRWTDEKRWQERHQSFGLASKQFWQWQEKTADVLWALALRSPYWPPQSAKEIFQLIKDGFDWVKADPKSHLSAEILADAFRTVSYHLHNALENLKQFVDGQLLISAQTTSDKANALYGASALDLPRRGVVHFEGGMGTIANKLVEAVRENGGKVLFRKEVNRIVKKNNRIVALETKRGESIPVDILITNLTPWNIARLFDDAPPRALQTLDPYPRDGWGAFMLYLGLDTNVIAENFPLHHQVILREPLAEGNTIFLSLSPSWDKGRAPEGKRAITISTHTNLKDWWKLFNNDRGAYEARQSTYENLVLEAAEKAIPDVREAADLVLPGTPVTFQRFTRRNLGWVGGYPQTNLFRTWGPRLGSNFWMVGDSIFPGQSTAAVALGGIRVSKSVLHHIGEKTSLEAKSIHPKIRAPWRFNEL
jgi:C-3',4' desaturase CrtD